MPRGNPNNFKKKSNSEVESLKAQVALLRKNLEENKTYSKFGDNVEELNEEINKMVSINLNLQSKMTELLIKVTDLIRENRELISLLEEASEQGEAGAEGASTKDLFEGLLVEMRKITKNTFIMGESFRSLDGYMRKAYTKGLLSKVIGGKIEEEPGEAASSEAAPPAEGESRVDEL